MTYNMTEEQRKRIKANVANHKHYDKKRFGTVKETLGYTDWLEKYAMQGGVCYWTAAKMTIGEGKPSDASLDRVDCSLPHTADNTVLCHKALNLGRNDTSLSDWVNYLYSMGILCHARVIEFSYLLNPIPKH
jgi:hypothetical protein